MLAHLSMLRQGSGKVQSKRRIRQKEYVLIGSQIAFDFGAIWLLNWTTENALIATAVICSETLGTNLRNAIAIVVGLSLLFGQSPSLRGTTGAAATSAVVRYLVPGESTGTNGALDSAAGAFSRVSDGNYQEAASITAVGAAVAAVALADGHGVDGASRALSYAAQ